MEELISEKLMVNYEMHGNNDDTSEVIIFLHGFPEFNAQWNKQVDFFSKRYKCICPDLRGFNNSPKPDSVDEYSIEKVADDIKYLINELSLKNVILVGHDWGGIASWILTSKYPNLIKKLIIINAPHPKLYEREVRNNSDQQEKVEYALAFRRSSASKLLARKDYFILNNMLLDSGLKQGYFDSSDVKKYHNAWSKSGALDAMLNYYRASKLDFDENKKPIWETFQLSNLLDTDSLIVHNPTMVIWGDKDDALVNENLNGLDQYVSDLKIERFPENSHWIVHETPEVINKLISNFIEE